MPQPNLISLTDPHSPAAEAYRTLRTNLEFSSLDRPLRSLLVTSPAADPDKVTTLANLAVIMAEGGRKVILVDGDLRKPSIHEIFCVPNSAGLSDLMDEESDLAAPALQESGVAGVQLLTSGPLPPNPSVLLGSERMAQVIAALTGRANLLLLNAPPVVAVTDAALLAARVDGTLLVIRAGGSEREHVRRAKDLLQKVNAHLVGAVLTHTRMDSALISYYK